MKDGEGPAAQSGTWVSVQRRSHAHLALREVLVVFAALDEIAWRGEHQDGGHSIAGGALRVPRPRYRHKLAEGEPVCTRNGPRAQHSASWLNASDPMPLPYPGRSGRRRWPWGSVMHPTKTSRRDAMIRSQVAGRIFCDILACTRPVEHLLTSKQMTRGSEFGSTQFSTRTAEV
jgi:hypothetical protein